MPYRYIVEMFCDRVAASKVYLQDAYTDDAPLAYFERGKKNRLIHPETSATIEKLLKMLSVKGEEYTFKYIRRSLKRF